jgi:hypothetical protein
MKSAVMLADDREDALLDVIDREVLRSSDP